MLFLHLLTHVRESGFRNREYFLPVEQGVPGLWNPKYSSRNPESQVPLTKNLESSSWESGIQNPQRGIQKSRNRGISFVIFLP